MQVFLILLANSLSFPNWISPNESLKWMKVIPSHSTKSACNVHKETQSQIQVQLFDTFFWVLKIDPVFICVTFVLTITSPLTATGINYCQCCQKTGATRAAMQINLPHLCEAASSKVVSQLGAIHWQFSA